MPSSKHPWLEFCGGGASGRLHDPSKVVDRPTHLHYDEANATYFTACTKIGTNRTHKLYYEVRGGGPTKIVFISGLGGGHVAVANYVHFLEAPNEYSVLLVDTRGMGFSDVPSASRWRSTDAANDVLQLLSHLGSTVDDKWRRAVHVVGVSMGGMIALETALTRPDLIASLTLCSTHAGGILNAIPPLNGLKTLATTFASLHGNQLNMVYSALDILYPLAWLNSTQVDDVYSHKLTPQLSKQLSEHSMTPNRYFAGIDLLTNNRKFLESSRPEITLDHTLRGVVSQVPIVLTHYVSWSRLEHLRKAKIPVLVIFGKHDALIDSRNGRLLADALDGQLVFFDDAGHGANEQKIGESNNAMKAHFAKAEMTHARAPPRIPYPPRMHPYAATVVFILAMVSKKHLFPTWYSSKLGRIVQIAVAVLAARRCVDEFRF